AYLLQALLFVDGWPAGRRCAKPARASGLTGCFGTHPAATGIRMQLSRLAASLGRPFAPWPQSLAVFLLVASAFFIARPGLDASTSGPVARRVASATLRPPAPTPIVREASHAGPPSFASPALPGSLDSLARLALPFAYAAGLAGTGEVDYSDPVGQGAVPLVEVAGRWDEPLGHGFRVRDFASRDGAPYARIAGELVAAMDLLRARAGSLVVISGYRHRAYNDLLERSAAGSQHIAGRAADVWSGTKTPLQLAGLALETLGCGVGLGLGANTLHVDLRGYLASWAYPGAALDE